eukprot:COSAG02_NODE_3380_length_6838_cov_9.133699_7_plen_70_part_00
MQTSSLQPAFDKLQPPTITSARLSRSHQSKATKPVPYHSILLAVNLEDKIGNELIARSVLCVELKIRAE